MSPLEIAAEVEYFYFIGSQFFKCSQSESVDNKLGEKFL